MSKSIAGESEHMANYDIFAKFYDEVMGKRDKTRAVVSELIEKHNHGAKTVLELAAGTGQNLANLANKYDVSGLDLSAGMLNMAQAKLPNAKFYHQSMVDFEIDQEYDVILSLFDSVNHLLDFEDWKRMFKSVQKHLGKNGVFIFDVNTPEKLQRVSLDKPLVQKLSRGKMEMTVKDEGGGIVNWKVKYFEDGSLVPQEENIREIAYPSLEIKNALEEVFSQVETKEDLNPETGKAERVYFSCKK